SDPDDIWCQIDSTDVCLPINSNGTPENMRVLSATLNMLPFAETIALRAPHVSVEGVQDEWIEGLDPDGLATVLGTLRERLEHLEQMHGRLEVARAEWRAGRWRSGCSRPGSTSCPAGSRSAGGAPGRAPRAWRRGGGW